MARECSVCGKRAVFGNMFARRGMAKYLGGVGIKTTGVTRRQFRPNLQKIRVEEKNGTRHKAKVCTQCIRSGLVKKPIRRDIPEGLLNRMRAEAEAKTPEGRKKAAAKKAERRRQRRATMRAKTAAKAAGKAAPGGKAPPAPPAPKGPAPKGKK